MIVVADTSPLNYLVLIGEINLLPALFGNLLIPDEVHRELQRLGTPPAVRDWAANLPVWCEVRFLATAPDASLNELDAGECDAIQLALELGADTLLIDDSEGRREAMLRSLQVTGTVAVLEKAAQSGWIDFHVVLHRLLETNFRLSAKVRDDFMRRNT
jgi:predicted nucleic acid-binding protein